MFASRDDKENPQACLSIAHDQKTEISLSMKDTRASNNTVGEFDVGYTSSRSIINPELSPAVRTGMKGLAPGEKELLYTINQQVPFQAIPLDSFQIEDQLDDLLLVEPEDVVVKNNNGYDVI